MHMAAIHITDIEAAINHWREKSPSPDGITLAPPLRALAEVYALMAGCPRCRADLRSLRSLRSVWPGQRAKLAGSGT